MVEANSATALVVALAKLARGDYLDLTDCDQTDIGAVHAALGAWIEARRTHIFNMKTRRGRAGRSAPATRPPRNPEPCPGDPATACCIIGAVALDESLSALPGSSGGSVSRSRPKATIF